MSKQISAVEWLVEELTKQNMFMHLFAKEIEQAKAMEKEQIIEAYKADCDTLGDTNSFNVSAEQYYNKTFKSE